MSVVDAVQVRRRLDAGETLLEIAADVGRSAGVLRRALRAEGLPVPPWRPPRAVLDPVVLRDMYLGQLLSIGEIAARVGYSCSAVAAALRAAGIPRRGQRAQRSWTGRPVITEAQLAELYVRRALTARQVATELGCDLPAVAAALKRHVITRPVHAECLDVDRETLTRLYVTERLSDKAIGVRFGVSAMQVSHRRRELNVHRDPAPPPRSVASSPAPPSPGDLHRLYVAQGLPIRVIAEWRHTSTRTVRGWLTAAGYQPGRRGDRVGAPSAGIDPELVALYADPEVTALLRRHQLPRPPDPGRRADGSGNRSLSRPFVEQAYRQIGLSVEHIARLTGHTPDQVLRALQTAGIRTGGDPSFSAWAARAASRITAAPHPGGH